MTSNPVDLWQQRMIVTRQALRDIGNAIDHTRMFPVIQRHLKASYLELNDYVLTCYEEIARHKKETRTYKAWLKSLSFPIDN